jgi:hypothetical protein
VKTNAGYENYIAEDKPLLKAFATEMKWEPDTEALNGTFLPSKYQQHQTYGCHLVYLTSSPVRCEIPNFVP